ncbi:hypothetical protein ACLKA7_004335 [Drosophila subpalustris]
MGIYDTRPLRPNSIELRRSYQSEQIDGTGYEQLTPQAAMNQYAAAYGTNGMSGAPQMHLQQQQQQQMYDGTLYHQSHAIYGQSGQGAMSPEPIYGPGTPSRNKPRPSQPPPAPPSNGSGGGTPTASNANTPTRGRSMSTSRDALPPPPPVPDAVSPLSAMNGAASGHMAAKLLGRTNSTSRAGSPLMAPSNSAQNANDMVLAQLNNTFNSMTMTNSNQLNSLSDLPPPPPVPDQHSPKMSPPNVAPPPPPPPPPVDDGMNPVQMPSHPHQIMPKALANGELHLSQANGGSHMAKKMQPPFHDPRNDLMKAIRDGISLRKVEKSELKEIERNTAMLDVASILARRVAIELSESEDSDSEDDSEGWMETNETSA